MSKLQSKETFNHTHIVMIHQDHSIMTVPGCRECWGFYERSSVYFNIRSTTVVLKELSQMISGFLLGLRRLVSLVTALDRRPNIEHWSLLVASVLSWAWLCRNYRWDGESLVLSSSSPLNSWRHAYVIMSAIVPSIIDCLLVNSNMLIGQSWLDLFRLLWPVAKHVYLYYWCFVGISTGVLSLIHSQNSAVVSTCLHSLPHIY